MKKSLIALSLFFISSNSHAVLSCSELSSSIALIDDYADEVFFDSRIGEASLFDSQLRILTSAVDDIAVAEKDLALQLWATDLAAEWQFMSWNSFRSSLDRIADRLDYFYQRDC